MIEQARKFALHDRVCFTFSDKNGKTSTDVIITGTVEGGYRNCGDPACNKPSYSVKLDRNACVWEVCESVLRHDA